MSRCQIAGIRITGISTCVPACEVDNQSATEHGFTEAEIRKVSAMAGIKRRRVVQAGQTSADLCFAAAEQLLERMDGARDAIDALIMVTQSPDYFLPSTSCLLHERLRLADDVAAFDVGLGCSGYPYGLYLAATMLRGSGFKRVLLLHGETASLMASPEDRATSLLFGDAGSATLIEADDQAGPSTFVMHTDGSGAEDLIIRGGGFRNRHPVEPRDDFVHMDGAGIFNFTIRRVPPLIESTLGLAQQSAPDVDYFVFHQSNQFIMKHLMKKCELTEAQVPLCLERFGNTGGPSVPLTVTQAIDPAAFEAAKQVMFLGYGVGLSWASALTVIERPVLCHTEI